MSENMERKVEKLWVLGKALIEMQRPTLAHKVAFFRLMAVTQKAGLGIREALIVISDVEKHKWLKKLLLDLIDQINQWIWVSAAMGNHMYFFDKAEVELIKSAEQMWNLPETLENMSNELEKFQEIKGKLKSAMMYPVMILIFAAIAVCVLLIKVIPVIVDIFPPELTLPRVTTFMMSASDFLIERWYVLIWWVILVYFWSKFLYQKVLVVKIMIDRYLIAAPVLWDLIKTFHRYRFTKLLWDFYDAGISPLNSLNQIWNIFSNYHYKKKLYDVEHDLQHGYQMWESMEGSWLFNPILVQLVGIGEEAWDIGWILKKISWFYRTELETKVEWITKLIEPILMVFVAGIIWMIVAAIFLPLGDMVWGL